MKTIAVIAAGGFGKRLGTDISKQYLSLSGLPVVVRTLRVFENAAAVSEIMLVVPQSDMEFVREKIVDKYGVRKVRAVVAGGAERQDSVGNALAALDGPCDVVVVHDAVRPFVSVRMIDKVIEEALITGAASIGVAAKAGVAPSRWVPASSSFCRPFHARTRASAFEALPIDRKQGSPCCCR